MDYSKIDAPLAAQLKSKAPNEVFSIFIGASKDLGDPEHSYLRKFGINFPSANIPKVFSATVSAQAIDELSEQPWIRYLKLSTKLRTMQ
jgi:hypothetical protein